MLPKGEIRKNSERKKFHNFSHKIYSRDAEKKGKRKCIGEIPSSRNVGPVCLNKELMEL
jgi:hypothetical protein